MQRVDRRDQVVFAVILVVAALMSGAVGVVIVPGAVHEVLALCFGQVVIGVAFRWCARVPAVLVVAILVVTAAAALHPELRRLLTIGAMPWVPLAHSLAAVNLLMRSRSPMSTGVGVAALVAAGATVAVASRVDGTVTASAVLSALVPALGGALVAALRRLGQARQDRICRSGRDIAAGDAPLRRALLAVALRAENLSAATTDTATGAALRELRATALESLGTAPTSPVMVTVTSVAGDATAGSTDAKNADGHEPAPDTDPPTMSDRDREIIRLLVQGASNAAIARELYLSEATVKGLVSRLMRRFDCDNRTQLAVRGSRWVH